MSYEFYVLEKLSQNVILGLDFLESNGAAMDLKTRTISFFDTVVMNYKPEANEESQLCLVSNAASHHCRKQSSRCRCSEPFSGIGLIGPGKGKWIITRRNYGVARFLVKPENGKTVCRILNPTKETIRLQSGTNYCNHRSYGSRTWDNQTKIRTPESTSVNDPAESKEKDG